MSTKPPAGEVGEKPPAPAAEHGAGDSRSIPSITAPESSSTVPEIAWISLGVLAGLRVLLHLLTNGLDSYGIFRDEYYYLACADRLAWGYVDQPPLSIFLLWVQRALVGDSLFALRLLPSLAGGALVLLGGLLAREFGGRRYAQFIAGLLLFFAPIYLSLANYYSMNSLDQVAWAGAFLLLAKLARKGPRQLWLLLGIVLGLGLLNKISVLYLGVGLLAGLLLTRRRRDLLTPWPWLAAAIAAFLFLPHILWQIGNGWPTLEFIDYATTYKNQHLSPLQYMGGAIIQLHPAYFIFWALGATAFWFDRRLRPQRWAFWTASAVMLILMISTGSKAYYSAPAFIPFFAAAGLPLERWLQGRWQWVRLVLPAVVVLFGVTALPLAMPVLPPRATVDYMQAAGMTPSSGERGPQSDLPQFYADRFGWTELAEEVALAFHDLPPEDQRLCSVFAQNYGQAGSLEYYRDEYGLPPILSGHNNYYLWGPRGVSGEVMIVLGGDVEDLYALFDEVELAGIKHCRWCKPDENELPVYVVKGARFDLEAFWPEVKHFD